MTGKVHEEITRCHNAEPGTYGHECGKPATWVGTSEYQGTIYRLGFCDHCKRHGYEGSKYADDKIERINP